MTHISINKKINLSNNKWKKKIIQKKSFKPIGIWYSYYNRWLNFLLDDSGLIKQEDILYIYI